MTHDDPRPAEGGYERSDARLTPIVGFVAALTVVCVLVAFGVRWMFDQLERRAAQADAPPSPMAIESRPPPPYLQADPNLELARQRARESELLEHYAWVDRDKGLVRIPIERAMELVLERGLPTRK